MVKVIQYSRAIKQQSADEAVDELMEEHNGRRSDANSPLASLFSWKFSTEPNGKKESQTQRKRKSLEKVNPSIDDLFFFLGEKMRDRSITSTALSEI